MHYLCTVPLQAITIWFAFLEKIIPSLLSHDYDNRPHGGHQIGGMDLKLIPMPVQNLSAF